VNFRRFSWLAPLAAVLTAGCFATRNDVRLLKADIERLHAESETARKAEADRARADQSRRDSLAAAANRRLELAINHLGDTLRTLGDELSRFRAVQATSLSELQLQIETIQQIVGVTQQQLRRQAAQAEAMREAANSAAGSDSGAKEGPRVLYQVGMDQLQKSAYGQARSAFQEVLDKFPRDSLVPDAMYQIGMAYYLEKADAKADSAFAAVVRLHPKAARAASALYKRAFMNEEAGRTSVARTLYQQMIRDYPSAEETVLAKTRLSALPNR
jgi:tol-pal system protein YbgF